MHEIQIVLQVPVQISTLHVLVYLDSHLPLSCSYSASYACADAVAEGTWEEPELCHLS